MDNNNGILAFVISGIVILVLFVACSSMSAENDKKYKATLESGVKKYYSGDTMTKEEYNAVKGYNNWKSKQQPKTYSDWNK